MTLVAHSSILGIFYDVRGQQTGDHDQPVSAKPVVVDQTKFGKCQAHSRLVVDSGRNVFNLILCISVLPYIAVFNK